MNADRINELYEGKIFDSETQMKARERIHWICRQARGKRILDIGCSQGIVCLLLAREGFNCVGIDYEKTAIEYALEELKKEEDIVRKRVEFKIGDAVHLSFEDDSFDTVILGEILEHLNHPEKVLKEAKRVLKDGGMAIITVPFGLSPNHDHKRTYYPVPFLETVQPFFKTDMIDTIDNYIAYHGIKDASYNISKVPKEDLLFEKLRLQRNTEERALSKEQELFDKANQLYDKIRTLNEQVSGLSKRSKALNEALSIRGREFEEKLREKDIEYKKTVSAKESEIKGLQAGKAKELEDRGREFEAKLREKEAQFRRNVSSQEQLCKHAWKWRIGSVFVDGYILVRDCIKHPVRFIKHAGSRFREYYNNINPQIVSSENNLVKIDTGFVAGTKQDRPLDGQEQKVALGCILDEFTAACFQPECKMITFRPDNWKEILERDRPQAIFVESAWRGNDASWQYRVAKYQKNMGDELLDLLAWAKEKKIPSFFWNKEDPAHYDRFIEKAELFDYVFTSDAECVPEYQKQFAHDRIFPLTFAAQPRIHNPILEHDREHKVSFAGTYYGGSHEERKRDMEILLKPALDYDLHIYDRQFGMTGPDSAQFRFPDIYQPAIKGRLEYKDMLKAYKNYKVFLNVNSIKTSPTMFSRRVFELLACGTPVISSYSKGIEELFGNDLVLITETEEDTKRYLEKLLNSEEYWSMLSVKGIRKVMENHTYDERLEYVLDKVGLNLPSLNLPFFTVVSTVKDIPSIVNLQKSLARQTYRNFDVVLILDNRARKKAALKFQNALPDNKIEFLSQDVERALGEHVRLTHSSHIAVFNGEDYYGPNYLKDYALSTKYAQYNYLGKVTHFVYDSGKPILKNTGAEFRLVSQVPVSTIAIKKEVIDPDYFPKLIRSEVFECNDKDILSLDRFNYMKMVLNKELPAGLLDSVGI
jgi:spore maturation protein CgeB/ubiquinone/menaquinone biosynthesis C-methylase UbiE